MSTLRDFVTIGFQRADLRLGRLAAPVGRHATEADERRALAVVESSAVGRFASLLVSRITAAQGSSASGRLCRASAAAWATLHWSVRRRALAVLLLAAATTHVLLNWSSSLMSGRLWLILPGVAVAVSLVLLLFSAAGGKSVSPR